MFRVCIITHISYCIIQHSEQKIQFWVDINAIVSKHTHNLNTVLYFSLQMVDLKHVCIRASNNHGHSLSYF